MIVVLITSVWLMTIFFSVSKRIHEWNNVVDDIKYLVKNIKVSALNLILKVLDVGKNKIAEK